MILYTVKNMILKNQYTRIYDQITTYLSVYMVKYGNVYLIRYDLIWAANMILVSFGAPTPPLRYNRTWLYMVPYTIIHNLIWFLYKHIWCMYRREWRNDEHYDVFLILLQWNIFRTKMDWLTDTSLIVIWKKYHESTENK